jgi:hypothetical protein
MVGTSQPSEMALAPFKMSSRVDRGVTYVALSGSIDERAQFIEFPLNPRVVVDLEGVNFINSVGTRSWCLWLQRLRAPVIVTMVRCPVIMVKSFSSIKSFVTDQCVVESFFIPFYSETTGERKDFLAIRGTHFEDMNVRIPEIRDSNGQVMDMDVIPEIYLSFLRSK